MPATIFYIYSFICTRELVPSKWIKLIAYTNCAPKYSAITINKGLRKKERRLECGRRQRRGARSRAGRPAGSALACSVRQVDFVICLYTTQLYLFTGRAGEVWSWHAHTHTLRISTRTRTHPTELTVLLRENSIAAPQCRIAQVFYANYYNEHWFIKLLERHTKTDSTYKSTKIQWILSNLLKLKYE